MHEPLSARARLALQLGLGAALLIAGAWLFGAIAEDVVTGDALTRLDIDLAQWLHQRATPGMTRWMLIVTTLHSTVAISCYAVIAAALAFAQRDWRRIVTLAVCIGGGLALNVAMKLAFHRARPVFEHPLLTLTSYSFPSGHTAAATIFYGLGVVWVFGHTRRLRWRVLALFGALLAIVLVASSRMYLGVHYLSDVAAAFAEGVAWLALCLRALAAFWRERTVAPVPAGNAGGHP
ncbi:MAG: phosphatase PAP2 family protein [Caldimonas sp.]